MSGTSPRVLVVDDEPLITQALCEALEPLGCQPTAAFNGRQALEAVEKQVPDLIVLDVTMPLMDGFQTLEWLRTNPSTRNTPVIMLTALSSDADMLRGLRGGATMYLTKPIDVVKFRALITAILGPRLRPR
ncbi:MAG: response regulator [Armatimonadetes bacterium]|nr:response regulator [Armatimonadota bacterium]